MPYFIDLGAGPAEEDCAQLGQTPDFDTLNRLEIEAYKCALIARYGAPPPGCRLAGLSNRHDFGRYVSLVLHIENELDEAVAEYAEAIEEGLATWMEAGFTAPVRYDGECPIVERRDPSEIIIGALMTTRPGPDGHFPLPDFALLHGNLAAAFPAEAAIARTRLAATTSA
ncbi:hypothetical protein [Sphingomonas corticis]|uniref:Uncharacterized protein n=1 Tax=Sphingomonas corticis TaxID=2722791 RepID=A0ABX1CXK5_9SPHN|nr:hypothetical protein [Sphingomonas corticis]NJR80705.1 hypothetical protein [Sphingomonas corticis]